MDAAAARRRRGAVRLEVAEEEEHLEGAEAGHPLRRGAAKGWKKRAADERLDAEEQERAEEDGDDGEHGAFKRKKPRNVHFRALGLVN